VTAGTSILRLAAVEKHFHEPAGILRVLDGLNLDVQAGEIVLLQGPSGSGKTTLLQITGCLLRADAGRVELAGEELNASTEDARTTARQQHLGFCFQHFHLLDALTVHDNVLLGLRLKRQALDEGRVNEVLALLGMTGKQNKRPRELSGGEKQRVAFARALAGRPTLLLADEPTSQLDAHAAGAVAEMVRTSVKESGCAALITTHDTRLHPVADRICTLQDGRISPA
jgi:putative ABC transport system ATP-binding protein